MSAQTISGFVILNTPKSMRELEAEVVPCTHDTVRDTLVAYYSAIATPDTVSTIMRAWDYAQDKGECSVTIRMEDGSRETIAWCACVQLLPIEIISRTGHST
jgi:hypothetical protein